MKTYDELAKILNKKFIQFKFNLIAESYKDSVQINELFCFNKDFLEYIVRFAKNHNLCYEIGIKEDKMIFKLYYEEN